MSTLAPVPGFRIEGHAIVSADDMIAAANGNMPPALSNDADWIRFQRALDAAAIVLLGRLSHVAIPNRHRRNRVVVSSAVAGVERRDGAWWWNPARTPLAEALHKAAPAGGTVAVPGGRLVFDLFRPQAFDAFHLARVPGITLPGGVPLFSAISGGLTADQVLAGDGLIAGAAEIIDPAAGVTLTTWQRSAT
jgi:hypothetical protein